MQKLAYLYGSLESQSSVYVVVLLAIRLIIPVGYLKIRQLARPQWTMKPG